MNQAKVNQALGRLADLFEYGHLQAETDPEAFLDRVTRELVARRAFCNAVNQAGNSLGREPDFEDPFEGPVAAAYGELLEAMRGEKGQDDR